MGKAVGAADRGRHVDADPVRVALGDVVRERLRAAEVVVDAGTLGSSLDRAGGLQVAVSGLQDTEAGRRVAEQVAAGIDVYARPILDFEASEFETEDGVAVVSRAEFSRILIRPVAARSAPEATRTWCSRAWTPPCRAGTWTPW